MKLPTALIVEDHLPIRRMVVNALKAEGYTVHEASSALQGETLAANRRIDVFLVDLGLPDDDGTELIRRLRTWTQRPILVLSGRTHELEKVEALDAGADDYLVKPFGMAELRARLRATQRRYTSSEGDRLRLGGLILDLDRQLLTRSGAPISLTPVQWRLLRVLARHPSRVVTNRQLLQEVWGPGRTEQAGYLRVFVHQLRRKLEADPAKPRHLLTESGVGYRLIVDD